MPVRCVTLAREKPSTNCSSLVPVYNTGAITMCDQNNFERVVKLYKARRQCARHSGLTRANSDSSAAFILNREEAKSLNYFNKFSEFYFGDKYEY